MSCKCAHCGSVLDDRLYGNELFALPRMSVIQTQILRRLIKGRGAPVHIELLVHAAYAHRRDGGPLNAERYVRNAIYSLKHRIERTDYKIVCLWGFGYRLERSNVVPIRKMRESRYIAA